MVMIPSWVFLLYFIEKMRYEALGYASNSKYDILFKILSCGSKKDKAEFRRRVK